jgi:LL-diaminopimelate aminotransferase
LPDIYIKQVQDRYQERRDFLIEGLGEMGWQITPSKATMYLWIPTPIGLNSTDFALDVLEKTGVVVTPGNAFGEGGEGYVRISLILDCDRLGEALARLKQAGISYDGDRSSNKSIAKIES